MVNENGASTIGPVVGAAERAATEGYLKSRHPMLLVADRRFA